MAKYFKRSFLIILTLFVNGYSLWSQTGDIINIVHHNIGPYVKVGGSQTVWMDIENVSMFIINDVDVYLQVGNTTYLKPLRNLDLNNHILHLFNFEDPVEFGHDETILVKLWVDNINGELQNEIDTIKIPVIALEQWAPKKLLVETFTSTDCMSCVPAGEYVRELENEYGDQMFSIGYQTNCYSNNPMCLLAQEYIENRMSYYGIKYTPVSVIVPWYKSNPLNIDTSYFCAILEQPSPINFEGTFEVDNTKLLIDFTINPFIPINMDMVELFVAITEDVVEFNDPPGVNEATTFHQVLRRMNLFYSDDISDLAEGLPLQITMEEDFEEQMPRVDIEQLRVGLFLQNRENKEIIQAGELLKLASNINIPTITPFKTFPNPTNGVFTILFTSTVTTDYELTVTNTLGSVIKTKILSVNPFEQNAINLSLPHANSGIYFVTLKGKDFYAVSKLLLKY